MTATTGDPTTREPAARAPSTRAFVEQRQPRFVAQAEAFLDQHPIHTGDGGRPRVSGTQLRNLLAAAQSGSPVAILRNFLHYQMGREKKSQAWNDSPSGHALIALLEREVEKPVAELALGEALRFALEAELAAQLLGFLSREYTYRAAIAAGRIAPAPAEGAA